MKEHIFDRLLRIAADIETHGNVPLTRLTILKKWLEKPRRLRAFALWIAGSAAGKKGKTKGEAGEFFREAAAMLCGRYGEDKIHPQLDRAAAKELHDRLRDFQNAYEHQEWGPVRIVHNWNLMLVDSGLAIYLWHQESPSRGYKLAADWCQHYDSRYGNGLNGPSRTKIMEIARFIYSFEGWEGFGEWE